MSPRLGLLACLASTLGCSLINALDEVVPPSGAGGGGAANGTGGSGAAGGTGGSAGGIDDPGMLLLGGDTINGTGWMVALAPEEGIVRETWDLAPTAIAFDSFLTRWIVFTATPPLPPEPIVNQDGLLHEVTFDATSGELVVTTSPGEVPLPWRSTEIVPLSEMIVYAHLTNTQVNLRGFLNPTTPLQTLTPDLGLPNEKPVGLLGHPSPDQPGGALLLVTVTHQTGQDNVCQLALRRVLADPLGMLSAEPEVILGTTAPISYDCQGGARRPGLAADPVSFTAFAIVPADGQTSAVFRIGFAPPDPIQEERSDIPGFVGISDVAFDACEDLLFVGDTGTNRLVAVHVFEPPMFELEELRHPPQRLVWEPFNDYVFDISLDAGAATIQPYQVDVSNGQPSMSEVDDWPAGAMTIPPGVRPRAAATRRHGPNDANPCD